MSRRFPPTIALALVSCFVLCQPALVAASTLSGTSFRSQPRSSSSKLTNSTATTPLTLTSKHSRKGTDEQPRAFSTEKPIKKSHSQSKNKKTSYLAYHKSTTKLRKLVHNHALPGNQEDCDACHNQCLIASLACIAISIATSCYPCGLICLGYQAACQTTCNSTTACKNLPLPVVNDN